MQIASLPNDILRRLDIAGLEPLKIFSFAVQIDGNTEGSQFVLGFDSIGGLVNGVETENIKEGGRRKPLVFPRQMAVNTLTLKKALSLSRFFWKWCNEVTGWTRGMPDYRKNLSIYMLDRLNQGGQAVPFEVWRWDIFNAWPSEWSGPELNANNNGLALESITLQFSDMSEAGGIFSGRTGDVLSLLQ